MKSVFLTGRTEDQRAVTVKKLLLKSLRVKVTSIAYKLLNPPVPCLWSIWFITPYNVRLDPAWNGFHA
ncbi:hypothetical protein EJB05_33121, partial [Eragrostis curvula]